jgi:hypothetical protein
VQSSGSASYTKSQWRKSLARYVGWLVMYPFYLGAHFAERGGTILQQCEDTPHKITPWDDDVGRISCGCQGQWDHAPSSS